MDPEALLEGLDEEQRRAVTSPAQPLVVLAPAGSGKTRVLTRRIAHRVAIGASDPRHVLALTFTRKAAGELTDRLGRLGLRADTTAGTFHGVAWGCLRARWADQGRTPPALLDRKARVLRDLLPRSAGRDGRSGTADLAGEIEWAKARMVTPDTYVDAVARAARRPPMKAASVAEAYRAYEEHKQRAGLVDFDDLLGLCARALEEDERFAAAQRWRFRHLYVDELQDVNPLQFRLLEAWRGASYDVTAVGDPQQAIYGWNGADAGFLLDIQRHWPPAEVIELHRSYRSTPEILESAATVLRTAKQPARAVEAIRPTGSWPRVASHPTDRDEAVAVARAVRRGHEPGRPWADQAVLVRTHAQTALLTEALREAGIPHRVRGASAFLDRSGVRRALRGLRDAAVPLGTALADLELSLEDDLRSAELDLLELDDDSRAELLASHADEQASLALLVRMGRDYLRLDPLGGAGTFAAWLAATVRSEGDAGPGGDAVDVATFHAAKGLEWGIVHLAGAEEGFVPVAHAKTAAAKAEEARLLYVAMTRAQRTLHLTWAERRTFASRVVERRPSPWLAPLVALRAEQEVPTDGPPTPPVEDWAAQVARQRATLDRTRARAEPTLDALRRWRDGVARAARVAPEAVLPDHVLARVAAAHPTDLDALGELRGVGLLLARRFGADILDVLAAADAGGR
jgi:DNA helicase II / ATP-dependent DNA helicase PcrA